MLGLKFDKSLVLRHTASMMLSCIYEIIFAESTSGKRYIGSTNDYARRMRQHRSRLRGGHHHCHGLQNAFNKHGESKMRVKVIEDCDVARLIEREQFWIDFFRIKNLYNIQPKADRSEHSEESRAKMSAALKGRKRTPEVIARMSASMRGIKKTPEHNAKVSAALSGKAKSLKHREKMSKAVAGTGLSGVNGVTRESAGKWVARSSGLTGSQRYLGSFATLEQAAAARRMHDADPGAYKNPNPAGPGPSGVKGVRAMANGSFHARSRASGAEVHIGSFGSAEKARNAIARYEDDPVSYEFPSTPPKSGFKWVNRTRDGKWQARPRINGKYICLGVFLSGEDASAAISLYLSDPEDFPMPRKRIRKKSSASGS